MKKLRLIVICLCSAILGFAVGPKVPCILTWTPNPPAEQVSGYLVYWKSSTNVAWTDAQRWPLSTNAFTGFDLRVLGLPQGDYVVGMSATNIQGGEGPLSDPIDWHYHNPNKPGSVAIKIP
jgi:hypothetical protein